MQVESIFDRIVSDLENIGMFEKYVRNTMHITS